MKKYTIKDFLAGKVPVWCKTYTQKEKLMKACKENGIKWSSGRAIEDFEPYLPVLVVKSNQLLHGKLDWYKDAVYFDEIDLSPASRYQIIIECDGDTTTAKMIVNGKEVKQATAKRNPADKANWRIGAQVAFDRLWAKQEKPEILRHEQPTKQKVREVYRKAKKDEWVRIVNKIHCTDCRYKNGDVLRVVREGDCLDDLSCGGAGAHYVEYVVLEGYKPGRDGK